MPAMTCQKKSILFITAVKIISRKKTLNKIHRDGIYAKKVNHNILLQKEGEALNTMFKDGRIL